MRYISILDRKTRKRLAFLQNAYDIGYKLEMNKIWSAQFTLPYDDPKNRYCQPLNYLEIYDGDEYIGLFRIIPARTNRSAGTQEITYECEHVIATLLDDVLVKWHEVGNLGMPTRSVIAYVLRQQTVGNWTLGDCDFSHQYLYGWENENLLTALFSIPNIFTERYRWDFETQQWPWTLHLRANPTEETVQKRVYNSATGQTETFTVVRHNAVAEVRYRKNMTGIEKTVDASTIVTRLYAFGYGEGENQLNISKVNPTGKLYIDADTQSQYGVISQVWVDRRYQYDDTLYQAAVKRLNELKAPKTSYSVKTAYIGALKKCHIGDIVRIIDDDDGVDVYLPVESIQKNDMLGAPDDAQLTFGSLQENAAGTVADLFERQKVEETYSQGAVTLFSESFQDNASADFPAEMRFYIPGNVVHINQILLQGRFTAFRGYSKATKGGGATSTTTQNGGGTSVTSNSGGSTQVTSASGGGSTVTSEDGGNSTVTSEDGGSSTVTSQDGGSSTVTSEDGGSSTVTSQDGGSSTVTSESGGGSTATSAAGGEGSVTSAGGGSRDQYTDEAGAGTSQKDKTDSTTASAGVAHYHEFSWRHKHKFTFGDHTHGVSIPSHSHSVEIPNHTHDVEIPDHTHDVEIPDHKHNVELPDHTHDVEIPDHKHNVEIPNHTHSVDIPDHKHGVDIPAHKHNFSIPDHTHNIEYGIYQGTTASSGALIIDGTTVGNYRSFSDLNLIPYLNKDEQGIVTRGWHTLKVKPNALTRVELDLVIQLFANSRGGGQY